MGSPWEAIFCFPPPPPEQPLHMCLSSSLSGGPSSRESTVMSEGMGLSERTACLMLASFCASGLVPLFSLLNTVHFELRPVRQVLKRNHLWFCAKESRSVGSFGGDHVLLMVQFNFIQKPGQCREVAASGGRRTSARLCLALARTLPSLLPCTTAMLLLGKRSSCSGRGALLGFLRMGGCPRSCCFL